MNSQTRRKPATLALGGNRRHQEFNRKWLVRSLESLERDSKRTAAKARRLADALAALTIDDIAANRKTTRVLLGGIANIGSDNGIRWTLAQLLGIDPRAVTDRRMAIIDRIFAADHIVAVEKVDGAIPADPPLPKVAKLTATPFSAESALTQACEIVAQMKGADPDDSDGNGEPLSERYRLERQAAINLTEAERLTQLARHQLSQIRDLDEEDDEYEPA